MIRSYIHWITKLLIHCQQNRDAGKLPGMASKCLDYAGYLPRERKPILFSGKVSLIAGIASGPISVLVAVLIFEFNEWAGLVVLVGGHLLAITICVVSIAKADSVKERRTILFARVGFLITFGWAVGIVVYIVYAIKTFTG